MHQESAQQVADCVHSATWPFIRYTSKWAATLTMVYNMLGFLKVRGMMQSHVKKKIPHSLHALVSRSFLDP